MSDVNDELWGGPLDGRSAQALGISEEMLVSGLTYNALQQLDDGSMVLHKYDLGSMQYCGQLRCCAIEWGDEESEHTCVMPADHEGACMCLCGMIDEEQS